MPDTTASPTRFGSNSGQSMTRRDGIAKATRRRGLRRRQPPRKECFTPSMCRATIARGRVTS